MANATKDKLYTIGSQGDDIKDLQTLLGVDQTGSYDQATQSAVTQYQKAKNLTVDGIVGDETLGALVGTQKDAIISMGSDEPKEVSVLQTNAPDASAGPGASAGSNVASVAAPIDFGAVNLPGISEATRQALSDLINNGYTPSQSVDAALRELNDIIENEPGEFTSKWSGQIDRIMDQILNREDFTYDFSTDPTYQIYRDLYQRQGRMAMMDTMGQAAALTGGYGSSYATTAGNQAYQNYLSNLNGIVPELQAQARAGYEAEGNRLNNAYALMSGERNQEMSEWQNSYNAWAADRAFQQSAYDAAKQYDYNDYTNRLSYMQNLAQQENAQHEADRQYAYQTAMTMLSRGLMPTSDMLAAAGISKADAKTIKKKNTRSSGSSSGSRTNPTPDPNPISEQYEELMRQFLQWQKENELRTRYAGQIAAPSASTSLYTSVNR